ncbi:ATP synthase subunit b [Elysia marginata]|uniref:ATP synthase subunit b n=1 Tax=Elysia marginata TaxID=1093978 RepID=A0AAV4FN28_9GAST|nr:ATP synthase subunit b [Elysia marginata]
MQNIQADNRRILEEAKKERAGILGEARKMKDQIVAQAKQQAEVESRKLLEQTKLVIERERKEAVEELKEKVATLSVSMAEVVLKDELSSKEKQTKLVEDRLKDIRLN